MTKEITKAIILQEMQDKLKLREFEPAKFLFDETVVPIYNIEPHLWKWEVSSETKSITSAATFLFFTVPENEEWHIRAYQFIFYNVGAYQISGAYIKRTDAPSNYIYMDLKENQAASYLVNLPTILTAHPGSEIRVLVDTYVSTANLEMLMDIAVEVLR